MFGSGLDSNYIDKIYHLTWESICSRSQLEQFRKRAETKCVCVCVGHGRNADKKWRSLQAAADLHVDKVQKAMGTLWLCFCVRSGRVWLKENLFVLYALSHWDRTGLCISFRLKRLFKHMVIVSPSVCIFSLVFSFLHHRWPVWGFV